MFLYVPMGDIPFVSFYIYPDYLSPKKRDIIVSLLNIKLKKNTSISRFDIIINAFISKVSPPYIKIFFPISLPTKEKREGESF